MKGQAILGQAMSWSAFLASPPAPTPQLAPKAPLSPGYPLITCPASVAEQLKQPALSSADVEWCMWAVQAGTGGGGVKVGKSWGKLTSAKERTRFDSLNCNAVHGSGGRFSCESTWGDAHVTNWRNSPMQDVGCNTSSGSNIRCYSNENKERFCVLDKVMIDFSKQEKVPSKGPNPASKKFKQDFMTLDCPERAQEPAPIFLHLLSMQTTASTRPVCDHVINETVVLYSHDNIRNQAHTLNDIMNVWLMLWLDRRAGLTSMPLLTVDALKQYNNFDDKVNGYFQNYKHTFGPILRGADFGQGTLCLKRVLMQPMPGKGFVWNNFFNDLPCSFAGPSSLFQRWNLHLRSNHGKLVKLVPKQRLKVLVIVRTESHNDWGSYRTSRLFKNLPEITTALTKLQSESERGGGQPFDLVFQDMGLLPYEQQLELVEGASVLVGIHGAGISHSQYMAVGTPLCCGVLEMFPRGEFFKVRGFGNMIRKMGLHYTRMDLSQPDSMPDGARVPVAALVAGLRSMLSTVAAQPSCVLEHVVQDPYLQ